MIKMIVFWRYDTFPYCQYGELGSITHDHFTVKGFDGMSFSTTYLIAVISEGGKAKEFMQSLDNLKFERREVLLAYDNKVNSVIREIGKYGGTK